MELNDRLIFPRKNIRVNQKKIIDSIIFRDKIDICIFCGSTINLTREHVISKWVFGNLPEKNLKTNTNGISQPYIKTTVTACSFCNTKVLSSLESELVRKFNHKNLALDDFSAKDMFNIILWLEIIEYKFQVLNMRRKFLKSKDGMFILYLKNIPILILQNDASLSISKVFSNLRKALNKLAIKSKFNRYNSLVLFKSTNKEYHFFHKTNEFIFLELANYGLGIFYFFEQEFAYAKHAQKEAMDIIKKVY
jgi:hypothetical protein